MNARLFKKLAKEMNRVTGGYLGEFARPPRRYRRMSRAQFRRAVWESLSHDMEYYYGKRY